MPLTLLWLFPAAVTLRFKNKKSSSTNKLSFSGKMFIPGIDSDYNTIGIIVCKMENEFVMEYCSDSRIYETTYMLVNECV